MNLSRTGSGSKRLRAATSPLAELDVVPLRVIPEIVVGDVLGQISVLAVYAVVVVDDYVAVNLDPVCEVDVVTPDAEVGGSHDGVVLHRAGGGRTIEDPHPVGHDDQMIDVKLGPEDGDGVSVPPLGDHQGTVPMDTDRPVAADPEVSDVCFLGIEDQELVVALPGGGILVNLLEADGRETYLTKEESYNDQCHHKRQAAMSACVSC